ncbi:MAG: NifB/NifX family molybdenum-iron cluster-binding protein [Dehalococcoidales bacterium]|nr:NifB/NifX family molybdenum-iron cluster-binding protein [Dehalococcoidales bacterium]
MRYAVPVSGGIVSQHFGHCEQFALIDVDEGKKQITNVKLVNSPGHEPGFLPQWLAEQGVSMVISSGMGSRAQGLFTQNNINVIIGIMESDPEKAVISHLQGTLSAGENICDH